MGPQRGPALEVGGDLKTTDGASVRPYLRAGATVFNDTGLTLTFGFLSAPIDVAPFTVASELDTVFSMSPPAWIWHRRRARVEAQLRWRFSENSKMHAGGLPSQGKREDLWLALPYPAGRSPAGLARLPSLPSR